MRKIIHFISLFVCLVLVFSVVPTTLAYQQTQQKHTQSVATMLEEIKLITKDSWQPGLFIVLLLALIQAVSQAIAQGNWFPGMISGAFILYLVLVWAVLFGQQ